MPFCFVNCTMGTLGLILELEEKMSGNCFGVFELFVSYLHMPAFLRHWVACS